VKQTAWRLPQVPSVAGFGLAIAGVAGLTWLLHALVHTHPSNLSLVYLALVLVLAVVAGSGPAILAAFLAFFALDWYFVPPVGHLAATGLDGWLALILFLIVAVLTGQLTAGFRSRAAEADRRARELSALYDLSVTILGDGQLAHVLQAIVERLASTLGAPAATLWLVEPDGRLAAAATCGEALSADLNAVQREAAQAALAPGRRPAHGWGRQPAPPFECVPVALGNRVLGAITVYGDGRERTGLADHGRLLHAFAGQAALAIERARLAREEARAREAAASERMKSVFLASVSHDLRTPLTAIRTAAAGLREALSDRLTPPLDQLTASIDGEAARLNRLVENLLEMSRIEAEGLPPSLSPEDLGEIIGSVVHRLRPLLNGRRLALDLPDDLPPVPLDAIQIDRVISNLLENAVKFSPPGSMIRLNAWLAGDRVCVRLRNESEPLSAEERLHIFDKFYRRAVAGASGGTGLGLAICKAIVEAHGGRICAEDDPSGVAIVFSLPAGPVASPSAVAPVGARA
jgi:two-component system sensor histidine kinase KdpD